MNSKPRNLRARLQTFSIPFPLVALILCLLAFGLSLSRLGFYWDDWPVIFYAQTERFEGIVSHFSVDRPFFFWTSLIGVPLAGVSALKWQVFVLVLRVVTITLLRACLKILWPKQDFLATGAALVFAIYPGIYVHPMAESLSTHWIAYPLFLGSLPAMAKVVQSPKTKHLWWMLALAMTALHIFTLEYFAGLELVRPIYLAIIISQELPNSNIKKLVQKTLSYWWPFLATWLVWLGWRFFILELPTEPYPLELVLDLSREGLSAVSVYTVSILKDFVYVFAGVWLDTVKMLSAAISEMQEISHWLMLGLTALISGLYLHHRSNRNTFESSPFDQAIIFGTLSFFAGLIPIWLIGENARTPGYGSRYMLAGIFGGAIFFTGLIGRIPIPKISRIVVIAACLALAVNGHLLSTRQFEQVWEQQRQVYWQLHWRAPAVKSNTAFLFFYPISDYMNLSSLAMAINTLYPQSGPADQADYWAFYLSHSRVVETLQENQTLATEYRGLAFDAQDANSLLFLYSVPDSCLWVLTPMHLYNDLIPSENRGVLSLAGNHRIIPNEDHSQPLSKELFGEEPARDWCYFYQKAELAAQQEDWEGVIQLVQEAEKKGLATQYGLELFPLVRAYSQLGRWGEAEQLANEIPESYRLDKQMFCAFWQELQFETQPSPERTDAIRSVNERYSCD